MKSGHACDFNRILICSPKTRALKLAAGLRQHGADVEIFPTLELLPLTLDQCAQFHQCLSVHHLDGSIFVSPYAVERAFSEMTALEREQVVEKPCYGVGLATEVALRKQGAKQIGVPLTHWSSEGLLNLASLQQVQGKLFLIFQGSNGRELIQKTLIERGASVIAVTTYHAICPAVDASSLIEAWHTQPFDLIIATSHGILENLYQLLGKDQDLLNKAYVTVMNERSKIWAAARGMTLFLEIQDPSTQGIIDQLSSRIVVRGR